MSTNALLGSGPTEYLETHDRPGARYFLSPLSLGNNLIGPARARMIADFVLNHPNRIETWYLADHCI